MPTMVTLLASMPSLQNAYPMAENVVPKSTASLGGKAGQHLEAYRMRTNRKKPTGQTYNDAASCNAVRFCRYGLLIYRK